jgi:hypothetical protein
MAGFVIAAAMSGLDGQIVALHRFAQGIKVFNVARYDFEPRTARREPRASDDKNLVFLGPHDFFHV